MSKYFSEAEFRRCTPSCHESDMDPYFLAVMDGIRSKANMPLLMSSAFRSVDYEHSKGRSGNSAHTRGKAVDFVANSSTSRYRIVRAAIQMGICRIGIGKNFVHVDCDQSLDQFVIWHYY